VTTGLAQSAQRRANEEPAAERRRPLRRGRWWLAGFALLVVALLVIVGFAALALWDARTQLLAARAEAEEGRRSLLDGDAPGAQRHFTAAQGHFDDADGSLHHVAVSTVALAPRISVDIATTRALAVSGSLVTQAGAQMSGAVAELPGGVAALAPSDGRMPVYRLRKLAEPLQKGHGLVLQAEGIMAALPAGSGLSASVAGARTDFSQQLSTTTQLFDNATALASALPDFLGGGTPRRYFFTAQNPAELRGTGGYTGAFAILSIDEGELRFGKFRPMQTLPDVSVARIAPPNPDFQRRYYRYADREAFRNLNLTPDFPSAAVAVERLYADSVGEPLDGVIAVDPFALEALVKLAGPVDVPGFGRVGASRVVEVLSKEAFGRFDDSDRRKRVLGAVAGGALEGFFSRGPENPLRALRVLGEAAAGGHMLVHAVEPDEQAALEVAGVAGRLLNPEGDFLAVIANNAAANKADYFTNRTVDYRVRLAPDGSARARATVTLDNRTPSGGLPKHVIGPNQDHLEAGDNRGLLSLYCTGGCELAAYRRNGDERLDSDEELGHPVFTTLYTLPSGTSDRVQLDWTLPKRTTTAAGQYRLTFQNQPTIRPTRLRVHIDVPPGMRVLSASKGLRVGATSAVWSGTPASRTLQLELTYGRPAEARTLMQRMLEWLSDPLFTLRK